MKKMYTKSFVEVLQQAKEEKKQTKSKVSNTPWESKYTNSMETIWIYLN